MVLITTLFLISSCRLSEQRDCIDSGVIKISNEIEVSFLEFSDSSIVYEVIKRKIVLTHFDLKVISDSILQNFEKNLNVKRAILNNIRLTHYNIEELKMEKKNDSSYNLNKK